MAFSSADDIIKQAYEKIGLLPDDVNLSGSKAQKGLDLLNAQLDQYAADNSLISYYSLLNFILTPAQREYTISRDSSLNPDINFDKIVALKYVNLISENIQYPVDIGEDHIWYRRYQNLNLTGRPRSIYLQNEPFLTNLIFTKKPEKDYGCLVKAKFCLQNLERFTDISTLPKYYILFLVYELARILADYNQGANWSAMSENKYTELKNGLIATNDMNLTSVTSSVLNKTFGSAYYYDGGYC